MANGLERLSNGFVNLSPGTQKLIVGLGVVAAATGPVLVAIGTLGAALPALTAGFAALGVTSVAALGPIGIAAGVVAAAGLLLYENWDRVAPLFESIGATLSGVASSLSSTFAPLGGLFASVADNADLLRPLGQIITDQLVLPLRLLAGGLDVVVGGFKLLVDLQQGDFRGALAGGKQAVDGLGLALLNIPTITAAAQKGFEGAAEGGGRFGTSLLQASGILTGFNVQLQGFAGGLPKFGAALGAQSGLLARLHEQLKQLKEDQQNAGTEKAALAFNPLIDNLEKYIARLEGNNKASRAAADALANLRKELVNNANASRALGDLYDYNGGRTKVLESGIKSLTDNGFAPGGKVVQGYVKMLKEVPAAIDQLAARLPKGTEKLFETPEFKVPQADFGGLPDTLYDKTKLPDYKQIFSDAAKSVLAGSAQLSGAQLNALDRLRDFNTNMGALTEQLNGSVGPALAGFAAQFGDAFGSIVTGTSSAQQALQSLFSGILQGLSNFMSEFGQQLISIGIGKLALDTLFAGPQGGPLAIAAGVGLVALAGIASSVAKGAASNLGSVSSGAISSPTVTNYGQRSNQTTIKVLAEFKLRGQDLIAIGRQQNYRSKITD